MEGEKSNISSPQEEDIFLLDLSMLQGGVHLLPVQEKATPPMNPGLDDTTLPPMQRILLKFFMPDVHCVCIYTFFCPMSPITPHIQNKYDSVIPITSELLAATPSSGLPSDGAPTSSPHVTDPSQPSTMLSDLQATMTELDKFIKLTQDIGDYINSTEIYEVED